MHIVRLLKSNIILIFSAFAIFICIICIFFFIYLKKKEIITISPEYIDYKIKITNKSLKRKIHYSDNIIYQKITPDIKDKKENLTPVPEQPLNIETIKPTDKIDEIISKIISPEEIINDNTHSKVLNLSNIQFKRHKFNIPKKRNTQEFNIEIGIASSEESLSIMKDNFFKKYPLISKNKNFIQKKIYQEKIFFILSIGPYKTFKSAQNVCNELLKDSQYCIIKKES